MGEASVSRAEPATVAVLVSGSGTNFQALLDRFHRRAGSPVRIGLLVASRPGIGALDRAREAGVPSVVLGAEKIGVPAAEGAADTGSSAGGGTAAGPAAPGAGPGKGLLDVLRGGGAELVVLAGWLKLVPPEVVQAYWGRMVNIHPALLPAFGGEGMYGRRVHEAVVERGVRVTGVTVHFVDERYDRGPVVAQWPVPVLEGDDPETLAERVLEVEHRVLPAVVEALARGRVGLTEEGRVRWRGDWFDGVRFRLVGHGGAA